MIPIEKHHGFRRKPSSGRSAADAGAIIISEVDDRLLEDDLQPELNLSGW